MRLSLMTEISDIDRSWTRDYNGFVAGGAKAEIEARRLQTLIT